jgi:UDP:flavonoid glycosyltransferase YjiC (YdhE family)
MKVLLASTPATGHLNPLLALARMLIAEGHEVVGLSASVLGNRIEGIGAAFRSFRRLPTSIYATSTRRFLNGKVYLWGLKRRVLP